MTPYSSLLSWVLKNQGSQAQSQTIEPQVCREAYHGLSVNGYAGKVVDSAGRALTRLLPCPHLLFLSYHTFPISTLAIRPGKWQLNIVGHTVHSQHLSWRLPHRTTDSAYIRLCSTHKPGFHLGGKAPNHGSLDYPKARGWES